MKIECVGKVGKPEEARTTKRRGSSSLLAHEKHAAKKQGTICVPRPGHIWTKLRRGRFSLDIRKNFLVVGIVENWNKFF